MLFSYLGSLISDNQRAKFEQIYKKYYNFMYHTALKITQSTTLAEDAVHDAFIQVLKEIDIIRLENENSLKYYLYTVTRERSIDFLRKWDRRPKSSTEYSEFIPDYSAIADIDNFVLTRVTLSNALDALYHLPDIYRHSLILSIHGYSIREIAQITHCSESAAKSHIYRARKKILSEFSQKA